MQVRCIRAHGTLVPGDVAGVPDGASVDPYHWERADGPALYAVNEGEVPHVPDGLAPVIKSAAAVSPREGM